VGLKSAVLRFLERRNYAVIHLDALERERDTTAKNLALLHGAEDERDAYMARLGEVERERNEALEALARLRQQQVTGAPAEARTLTPPPGANDLRKFAGIFDGIDGWSGVVPAGFVVDFFGTHTRKRFLEIWGTQTTAADGREQRALPPSLTDGANSELWFEAADWVLAAREARGRYVMITLGANYGYQAVGSCRALQLLNPMPYKLVAVEPIPDNMDWVRCNMRDNDIDPDEQWLLQAAIGANNDPVLFPIGSPGLGAQNCIATNEVAARMQYLRDFVAQGQTEEALRNILLHNTTGLRQDIIKGKNLFGEIRFVSAITLRDVLGPLERVDLLESDLQESEILVFPPFRSLLKRKVHRMHIGTHGRAVHQSLLQMFIDDGWEIVFSYEPETAHESVLGRFTVNDGVLSIRNPDV
jgi:hypothetical protein